MILKINDKEYELNFGIRFVRELDKKHHSVIAGKNIGTGLEDTIPMIFIGDMGALEDVLYAAMWREEKKPSQEEMDDFIDSVEDIEALCEETINELKNQNATRKKALDLVADLEERKRKAEEAKKQSEKILKKNMKN